MFKKFQLKVEHLRLLGDRVLVEPDPVETSAGNIVLPDRVQAGAPTPSTGTVVAMSKNDVLYEGAYVLYSPFAGDNVLVGGATYKVFDPKDIIAIINKPKGPKNG